MSDIEPCPDNYQTMVNMRGASKSVLNSYIGAGLQHTKSTWFQNFSPQRSYPFYRMQLGAGNTFAKENTVECISHQYDEFATENLHGAVEASSNEDTLSGMQLSSISVVR